MASTRFLNENALRENGITFDLELVTFATLSREHAEAANVQQGLLDFENVLSDSSFVCYSHFQLLERDIDLIHAESTQQEDTRGHQV